MQTPAKNTQVVVVHSTHVGSSLLMAAQRIGWCSILFKNFPVLLCWHFAEQFFFAQRVQQITFVENLFEVFEVRSETWSRIPSRLCKIRCLDTQRKGNRAAAFWGTYTYHMNTVLDFVNFTLTRILLGLYHLLLLFIIKWLSLLAGTWPIISL